LVDLVAVTRHLGDKPFVANVSRGGSRCQTRHTNTADRTRMKAQSRIPGHQTEGRISIHTVVGHLKVRAQGRTFDLPVGRLLALDQRLPHDVEALEDSAFLLTIAWPAHKQQGDS
jgi:quercetin dioxygenase-like cupin family protein